MGKHQRKMAAHPVVPTSVEAVISEAANLLLNGGYNQQYESDEILVRISAKCAPGAEHLLEYPVMRPLVMYRGEGEKYCNRGRIGTAERGTIVDLWA